MLAGLRWLGAVGLWTCGSSFLLPAGSWCMSTSSPPLVFPQKSSWRSVCRRRGKREERASREEGMYKMNLVVFMIASASAVNGLLAGLNMDTALVKLPTRRRIGAAAYATFARGSDLGNGIWVYPSTAIGAALLTLAATLVAYVERQSPAVLVPLSIAALTSIGHFLATARAAPIMLRVSKTPDDDALLAPLLDRFARWHELRATLQVLTFFVLLWALLIAH